MAIPTIDDYTRAFVELAQRERATVERIEREAIENAAAMRFMHLQSNMSQAEQNARYGNGLENMSYAAARALARGR